MQVVVPQDLDQRLPESRNLEARFDSLHQLPGVDVGADVVEEDNDEGGLVQAAPNQVLPELLYIAGQGGAVLTSSTAYSTVWLVIRNRYSWSCCDHHVETNSWYNGIYI